MCTDKDQTPKEPKEKSDAGKQKAEEKREWKDIIHLPDDLEYDVH